MAEVNVPRWVMSADNHVDEPLDLWKDLPPHLAHLAPRVEIEGEMALLKVDDRTLTMFKVPPGFAAEGDILSAVLTAQSFEGLSDARTPDARLADLDRDGIWAEVMFPNRLIFTLFRIGRPELQVALSRLYNDWLADTFLGDSDRFIPVGTVPVLDVEASVKEITRLAGRGFRGLLLPAHTNTMPHAFNQPVYDPIWAAAADLGMVVHFHAGTGRDWRPERNPGGAVINYALTTGGPQETVAYLCGAGVLARHPQLRVVMVECGAGWLAWLLNTMDDGYTEHEMYVKPKLEMPPSEYFRRQGAVTFQHDPVGFHNIPFTGDSCLMWGADYPHPEGTWPNSREYLERQLVGVDPAAANNVLVHNAARLYGIEIPADTFAPVPAPA